MTWFRVDVGIGRHELVGVIAEGLEVEIPTAIGLYVATLAGFAEFRPDGLVAKVTDTTLEEWAGWQGEPKIFARFFRRKCVETRSEQKDPRGTVKGWWRNNALLREQLRGRHRPGQGTREAKKAPRGLSGAFSVPSRGNGGRRTEDGDVDGTTPSSPPARAIEGELTPAVYTVRCTVAANRGLRENPGLAGSFNELTSSAQDEPGQWQAAGIPIGIAERTIYDRARSYRPRGSRRQPLSLGYFREAVRQEWEHEQARAGEGQVDTTPLARAGAKGEESLTEWVARREAERTRKATHASPS